MKAPLLIVASCSVLVRGFAPAQRTGLPVPGIVAGRRTATSLHAIGVLAKKGKEAALRQYIADGVEDAVMEKYRVIKDALASDSIDLMASNDVGSLQKSLTKRKGTVTLVAEYRRKMANGKRIAERIFDPEIMSPEFREFGAAAIAVMADERMGGCSYDDLKVFVEDQRRAHMEVPGPVPIINNDLVIDELQIARSAAYGASAVVLSLELLGDEAIVSFMKAAKAVDLESIVTVTDRESAQKAIDLGATMIMVVNVATVDERLSVIDGLAIPEGRAVTTVAGIPSIDDQAYPEIEDVWACRDGGFNVVWVNDALYKAGADSVEHPGAIIKSMTSKSSLKFASPKVQTGRGEGAREYLGDILM